jgi:hypothetical protein
MSIADRVKETTTTTGTGSYALLGASAGYQSFYTGLFGSTAPTTYCCEDGTNWEIGEGSLVIPGEGSSDPYMLTRTTIIRSSTGGAVSWGAGTKNIFLTIPAGRTVYSDGTGNVWVNSINANDASQINSSLNVTSGISAGNTSLNNTYLNSTSLQAWNGASVSSLLVNGGGGNVTIGNSSSAVTIAGAVTVGSLNSSHLAGFRNVIINGGFDVWLRGTSGTIGTYGYLADRWWNNGTSISMSKLQVLDSTIANCIRLTGTGTEFVDLRQSIERETVYRMRGKLYKLSYLVRVSGTAYSGYFRTMTLTSTTTDMAGSATDISGYGSGSVPVSGVWESRSVTLTVPAGAMGITVSLYAQTALPAGTIVDIANVQLEPGSLATPFEQRPIGIEKMLCQRYTRKQDIWVGTSASKTVFPIDMRVAPYAISGYGSGFTSTGTTADALICYQTTAGVQTLLLESEL